MRRSSPFSRGKFLARASMATVAAPLLLQARAFAANDRITMAGIGMGGQGRGNFGGFLGLKIEPRP